MEEPGAGVRTEQRSAGDRRQGDEGGQGSEREPVPPNDHPHPLTAEHACHRHRQDVGERDDQELDPGEDGGERDRDDGRLHSPRGALDRAQHRRQRQQEHRIGKRLGHEVRPVEHLGARHGRRGGEEGV